MPLQLEPLLCLGLRILDYLQGDRRRVALEYVIEPRVDLRVNTMALHTQLWLQLVHVILISLVVGQQFECLHNFNLLGRKYICLPYEIGSKLTKLCHEVQCLADFKRISERFWDHQLLQVILSALQSLQLVQEALDGNVRHIGKSLKTQRARVFILLLLWRFVRAFFEQICQGFRLLVTSIRFSLLFKEVFSSSDDTPCRCHTQS